MLRNPFGHSLFRSYKQVINDWTNFSVAHGDKEVQASRRSAVYEEVRLRPTLSCRARAYGWMSEVGIPVMRSQMRSRSSGE